MTSNVLKIGIFTLTADEKAWYLLHIETPFFNTYRKIMGICLTQLFAAGLPEFVTLSYAGCIPKL